MTKTDKKTIYILLITIIIFSSILIYKIETTTEYDKDLYEQVYTEYKQISDISSDTSKTTDVSSSDTNDVHVPQNETKFYSIDAILEIPKIDISYPVIGEYTESNLNIAPTKLAGPEPNKIGNYVIIAHNNWNNDFFSNLHKLEKNDTVKLTDTSGKTSTYSVYDIYEINQNDFSCLDQDTNKKTELTLITCVKYKKDKRLVVKCITN